MASKKQHLRYQAKKGRLQPIVVSEIETVSKGAKVSERKEKKKPSVKNSALAEKQEFTKLPENETQFVRKEIVYIGFIALLLIVIYVLLFLVFRFTGIDEWLNGLIQLNN